MADKTCRQVRLLPFFVVLILLSLAGFFGACGKKDGEAPTKEAAAPAESQTVQSNFNERLSKAQQGDKIAQYDVARLYSTGNGGARNPSEALRWYEKAAQQGMRQAQTRLGRIYLSGKIVGKKPAEAFQILKKAFTLKKG